MPTRLPQRRRFAAFFLWSLLSQPAASYAALVPKDTPNSNLNTHSVQPARPVLLKRSAAGELPDISDIFHGYSLDELPADIPLPTSAAPNRQPMNDDGLLILELRIGRAILDEAFLGYSKKSALMLPLGALADALQLPIRVDNSIGQAEGWYPAEADSFKLDARRKLVTRAGKIAAIDTARIEIKEDDIYIDSDLLAEWFAVDFNFSMAEQVLQIAGKNKLLLPVERLAKMEIAREALRLKTPGSSQSYPLKREPYHFATLPFADLSSAYTYNEETRPTSSAQGSLLTHGDLLYMNHRSYMSYNKDSGLDNIRLNLSRKAPDGTLFYGDDPLSASWLGDAGNRAKLTELQLGDIYSRQLPLTLLNQDGRGIIISNQPLNRAEQYDRTSISGDIQPDWDVELYRNEELLAFQRSTSSGRYEFTEVPLLSGLNIFRLVFYGPFGETREEIRRIVVNEEITKKGESYVSMLLMEQGRNLVSNGNNPVTNFSSSLFPSSGTTSNVNTRGMERLGVEYEYGLADQLALYAQAAHIPITRQLQTNAATLGMAGVWQEIYGRVDVSQSDHGGQAVQLISQTNLAGLNLSLRHQRFEDFLSDYTEDPNDPVHHRTILQLDGSVKLPILPRLSLGVAGGHTEYTSGRQRDEVTQRTTAMLFGRASLNHNISFTRDDIPGSNNGALEQMRGNTLISIPAWGAYLRGGVNYSIRPTTSIEAASITADYSLTPDSLLRGEIIREFTTNEERFLASINQRFSRFSLGLSGGITSSGEMLAGLSFNTGFGFEPRTGSFRSYPTPISSQGLVSARSFVDTNNNDQWDTDEEVLGEVDYLVNQGSGSSRNQDQLAGVQLIKYIPPHQAVPVNVNPPSLENPFLVATHSGAQVITRPGTPVILDFALKPAADVEGTVVWEKDGTITEAANVLIEAVDTQGRVIRSARSAFDGMYMLELVPIGEYTLRISPEQAQRLSFKNTTSQSIRVTPQDEYIQNMDFRIQR